MVHQEVYGAFASVQICFKGTLQNLADRLSAALNIRDFSVNSNEYPPYDDIGSAEALGWELWLEAVNSDIGVFNLRLETEHAVEEAFHGRMYDLSPWLARFLAMICNLDVMPLTSEASAKNS